MGVNSIKHAKTDNRRKVVDEPLLRMQASTIVRTIGLLNMLVIERHLSQSVIRTN